MVTREELHNMIDFLPDSILEASGQAFLDFLKKEDPVLFALLTAPEDDEPETEEERAAVDEVLEDIRTGRAELIPHDEVVKRLMESP
jgi:hypothetical protein